MRERWIIARPHHPADAEYGGVFAGALQGSSSLACRS